MVIVRLHLLPPSLQLCDRITLILYGFSLGRKSSPLSAVRKTSDHVCSVIAVFNQLAQAVSFITCTHNPLQTGRPAVSLCVYLVCSRDYPSRL